MNKLNFVKTGENTDQAAKWLGFAQGGRVYRSLVTIDQKEVRYSIFGAGGWWYLHIEDGSFRHEVFHSKHDAVASAQQDFALRTKGV